MSNLDNEEWTSFEPPEVDSDPLASCFRDKRNDLILRLFIGTSLALLGWHEVSVLAAIIAFVYVYFFLPRMTSHEMRLLSGRTVKAVRPTLTKYHYGRNAGKTVMDVTYTCCADDSRSFDLQREFSEVCLAVFESCDQRKLNAAEVTAELPNKSSFLGLNFLATIARTAEFEKVGFSWQEVDIP